MINQFSRTELLLGSKAIDKLKNSSVCVFGVGGVGSYVVEALARSGVGAITIIDNDDISVTNINRQLPAVMDTVGKLKVDVVKNHILQINPDCKVTALNMFYIDETKDASNTRDFQARRAKIRFKDGKKNTLCHTLNGSSLAVEIGRASCRERV